MTNIAHSTPPRSLADRIESIDHALRIKDLADLLAWSQSTLYDLARSGRMGRAVIRCEGKVRFDPYLTAQWLRRQEGM
jgi:predicted DNA-binding transcriptional regulator AlpA